MSFGHLPERVASALAARIGPGWGVALRGTALQLENGSFAFRAVGLDIRNPEGALVIRAPYAIVSVDGLSLLTANLQPRSIEFRDLQMRATLNRDGSLSFSTPVDPAAPAEGDSPAVAVGPQPAAVPTGTAAEPNVSPVSVAVGTLFELIVGPTGILGALDVARVTNARLALVDADQNVRATFDRVDATFSRTETGGRRFDAALDGPRGVWRLNGDATSDGGGGYHASVIAADAPVQDLLLLSGLSSIPATTDLEFSGRFDASFRDGHVSELQAHLVSNAGMIQIEDKDTSPLPVETAAIDAAWDESRRALNFDRLELKGGDTHVILKGELLAPRGEPGWKAQFTGRNATLAGAAPGDRPVKLDAIDAALVGDDGIEIKSLRVRGPTVSADLIGSLGKGADPRALKLDVTATHSDARSALRLWPEASASNVRRFLVKNLKGGMVKSIAVSVDFTGADLTKATSGQPIPDKSVRVEFKVGQGTLSVAEGLPPLSRAEVSGVVTGTSARIRASSAAVEMADGRSLAATDGSFVLEDLWRRDALAQIAFRLQGGADGLGALLRSPLIREVAGIDLDPAAMKGKADLRVAIPLSLHNIPKFADLPLSVTGEVSDLSVDKVFGKEKLENASLALAYNAGNLTIKGDGKIAGAPAVIDIRRTRDGAGEANVAFTLDEAARAKRGMSFGAQLAGPLALKAGIPLGKAADAGVRIEVDLVKATVDQLVPGWVKPAGKPGKLSFLLVAGAGGSQEIRDLLLDSGTVQLKGSALLSEDGGLDKADLTTFKLSTGDDMRAQIERAPTHYKILVRGNVGDTRPFTRGLSSPPAASRSGTSAQRESKDFDLDVALNILTGFNDEAITNASLKASVRKENIRSLELKGRLGASDLSAQTSSRAGGAPLITFQAEDAGAVFRFLDIYRRMSGGELVLQLNAADGPQTGTLTLQSFYLRNEPALRRIIPTQSQMVAGRDQAGNLQATRIDVNEVAFTKAKVDFTRTAGRIDFKDAAIWGRQVGFTLGGFIDYSRDRADIVGTFVPAYGLNNAFAQLPLVGPLLGGSQYEGLFAVNFRVSGQATAPVLTVNPLSAVAPGFLRRLFGAAGASEGALAPNPMPER